MPFDIRHVPERSHEPVAHHLDLGDAVLLQHAEGDALVLAEDSAPSLVAEAGHHLGVADEVGEEDSAESRGAGMTGGRLLHSVADQRVDGGEDAAVVSEAEQVTFAIQGHEPCARNACGDSLTGRGRDYRIGKSVQHESGSSDDRQQVREVVAVGVSLPNGAPSKERAALKAPHYDPGRRGCNRKPPTCNLKRQAVVVFVRAAFFRARPRQLDQHHHGDVDTPPAARKYVPAMIEPTIQRMLTPKLISHHANEFPITRASPLLPGRPRPARPAAASGRQGSAGGRPGPTPRS